jgi:hypothetical protein
VKIDGNVAYDEGTFTQLEGKYLEREPFLIATTASTLLRADIVYYVYQVQDTSISASFLEYGDLLAKFWYKFRSDSLRIDRFSVKGIGYDFLKSFNYENGKYQIIKMKKLYSSTVTEIEAIYLGEL